MNNDEGGQMETKTSQNTPNKETGFSNIDNTNKNDPKPKEEEEEKKEEDKEFELPCDLYLKLFAGILGMLYGKDEPAKEDDAKKTTKDDLQQLTDNSDLPQQEKDNIHKLYDTNHENAINGRNTEADQQENAQNFLSQNPILAEKPAVAKAMQSQEASQIECGTPPNGTKFETPVFNPESHQRENGKNAI